MRLLLIFILTLNLLYAKKIALLIGNDDYSFAPLENPTHDVDGLYRTLKAIGFDISYRRDVLKNVSQNKMQRALAHFSKRANSAEIALVYFSGHGMQVNNTNYMFPAKAIAKKPVDLYGLVDLNYFIQSASSAKYGIVLVDACRDNPLVKYFQKGSFKGSNAKKGLGQVTPTQGQVVIGFATSAGDTASDGNGKMSPYATSLKKNLKLSKDITKVLGLVAKDVSINTQNNQHPILRTNLYDDVCLTGRCKEGGSFFKKRKKVIVKKRKSNGKWITPNRRVCRDNGGKIKNGVCMANWKDAKYICKYSNGRLPKHNELKNMVSSCRGRNTNSLISDESIKNKKNNYYQNCYTNKGFKNIKGYWSSRTYVSNYAWIVYLYYGYSPFEDKNNYGFVRCVPFFR